MGDLDEEMLVDAFLDEELPACYVPFVARRNQRPLHVTMGAAVTIPHLPVDRAIVRLAQRFRDGDTTTVHHFGAAAFEPLVGYAWGEAGRRLGSEDNSGDDVSGDKSDEESQESRAVPGSEHSHSIVWAPSSSEDDFGPWPATPPASPDV